MHTRGHIKTFLSTDTLVSLVDKFLHLYSASAQGFELFQTRQPSFPLLPSQIIPPADDTVIAHVCGGGKRSGTLVAVHTGGSSALFACEGSAELGINLHAVCLLKPKGNPAAQWTQQISGQLL